MRTVSFPLFGKRLRERNVTRERNVQVRLSFARRVEIVLRFALIWTDTTPARSPAGA